MSQAARQPKFFVFTEPTPGKVAPLARRLHAGEAPQFLEFDYFQACLCCGHMINAVPESHATIVVSTRHSRAIVEHYRALAASINLAAPGSGPDSQEAT